MSKVMIGIDNGVSGSIGIIDETGAVYLHTPVRKALSYTKAKHYSRRVDVVKLKEILLPFVDKNCFIIMERPMVNPFKFQATASALRALEATLIVLEELKLAYMYIDSKRWQKNLLPSGCKGKELKNASKQIGQRLFPKVDFESFDDADGLLIAEYARRLDSTGGLIQGDEE